MLDMVILPSSVWPRRSEVTKGSTSAQVEAALQGGLRQLRGGRRGAVHFHRFGRNHWRRASGAFADTLEIAKRERVRDNYVRRLIPLALLAPPIVEAICAGRRPVTLAAERLRRGANLPFEWHEQLALIAGE